MRVNMPGDRPTEHELAFFPELWESIAGRDVYLFIRNTAIMTWHLNLLNECTTDSVRNRLKPPFDSDVDLIHKIVAYLTRHGIINFGRFTRQTRLQRYLPAGKRTVAVIGAGAAGIAAASQLKSFGFDVIVLEGRERVGGRVQSFRSKGQLIEAGCDMLHNIYRSPLEILIAQMEEVGLVASSPTRVYCDGKLAHEARHKLITSYYKQMCEGLHYLAHNSEQRDEVTNHYVSRQRVFENLFNMIERRQKLNYFNYCSANLEMSLKREEHFQKMGHLRNVAMMAEEKLLETPLDDHLLQRSLFRDIKITLQHFDEEFDAFQLVENHLLHHKKHPCAQQYMAPGDFRQYNFHLGFEEILQGAQLEKLQFTQFTSPDKIEQSMTRVPNGIYSVLAKLARDRELDIRCNTKVCEIDTTMDNLVRVVAVKDDGEKIDFTVNFVVSTIPNGVLKKTVENDPIGPKFEPPLPKNKVEAIKALGKSIINKIILVFERNFWEDNGGCAFCNIAPTVPHRASMTYWTSLPGSNVLTTYFVGEMSIHKLSDEILIKTAMDVLKKIFPVWCPDVPQKAFVTRWHTDEFAFGTGSFRSLTTKEHHFDDLIEPLKTKDGENRVYFAGEATSAQHLNTIQGAWTSGMRAAADLANDHNGPSFVMQKYVTPTSSPVKPPQVAVPSKKLVVRPASHLQVIPRPAPRQSLPPSRPAFIPTPVRVSLPSSSSSSATATTASPQVRLVRPLPPTARRSSSSRVLPDEVACLLPDELSSELTVTYARTLAGACSDRYRSSASPSLASQPSTSNQITEQARAQYQQTLQRQEALQRIEKQLSVPVSPLLRTSPQEGSLTDRVMDGLRQQQEKSAPKNIGKPSPRPSTSGYVSSRPSTSAYASPARQVPPTRFVFQSAATATAASTSTPARPSTPSSRPRASSKK
uniref:SWIRM domain-containing protein n=1 Tax=Caenorhabditis japonica TaxID=281687 RepID=A0A8R1DF79_CAEJA